MDSARRVPGIPLILLAHVEDDGIVGNVLWSDLVSHALIVACAPTTLATVNILSIQSSVAYGHAGNSAAVFPLQRLGHEVWPVYTVQFSNHTGYGEWRGPVFSADTVRDVLLGIEERGVFPRCDAVLSGYQGAPEIGKVVLDAVTRVKAANPSAVYCADPVMGDVDFGFYVQDGIPQFMRDNVVPVADVITPNHFELNYLVDRKVSTMDELLAAADELRSRGPRTVLITSVQVAESPPDSVQMVAVNGSGAWAVSTPHLPMYVSGSGDATAAIFLAHLMSGSAADALAATADSLYAILQATYDAGAQEILLVQQQDALVNPQRRFEVSALR